MNAVIHVNEKDNLVTCLRPIKKGEYCYKYGEVIGEALEDLAPGDYVHVHNLASTRGRGDLESSHGGQN